MERSMWALPPPPLSCQSCSASVMKVRHGSSGPRVERRLLSSGSLILGRAHAPMKISRLPHNPEEGDMPIAQKAATVVAPKLAKMITPTAHAVIDYAMFGAFFTAGALLWS